MSDKVVLSLGGLHVGWEAVDAEARAHITLQGQLDSLSLPALNQALDNLYAEQCFSIDVDLSELSFVDSSGLGALVAGWRRCDGAGGYLRAHQPTKAVRRLFDLTGIGKYLLPAD